MTSASDLKLSRLLARRSPEPRPEELRQAIASVLHAGEANTLGEAILEGLRQRDMGSDRIDIAVTGMGWLGSGVPSVQRTLQELLSAAREEVQLTAYSITSGSELILVALEQLADSGVRCTIIVNDLASQPVDVRTILLRVADNHADSVALFDFPPGAGSEGLHAKVVVVDRSSALVGSSNLTFHGMVASHELAVLVRGPAAARIADRIDLLARSPAVERVRR